MPPLEEVVGRAGLSVSAVRVSDLEASHRVDSEYYLPECLNQDARIRGLKPKPLSEVAGVSDGNHMTIKDSFAEDGVRYLRGQDLTDFFISDANPVYIPQELYDGLSKRCHMKAGDILLSIVGTIGGVALVTDKYRSLTGSCKIAILRPQTISPYFLAAYLMSKVGQAQIRRRVRGAVQQGLILPDLNLLPIPTVDNKEQQKVEILIKQGYQKQGNAELLYAQAQSLLVAELGLDKLDLSESLYSVRHFSEVVGTGRADAEYYRLKYERLLEHLRHTGQAVRLGDWLHESLKRGVQPQYDDEGEILVINSQHVGKTYIELEDNRLTTDEFCETGSNRRARVRQNDVLLNSTGYITIGRCQTLLEDVKAIVDGHVTIVRPKEGLDPVYLGLFLNAPPGQMQTERGWTGSSGQIELRTEVIADFVVWRAPVPIQRQIRQLVEQSHRARCDARRLLGEAKAQVERVITEAGGTGI